jgi:3-oxoacyl-[acyl-carrier protein] reductase
MEVRGKAALITGGGTGVGRATALALGRLGCAVAVNYSRSRNEAEATAAEVAALGVESAALEADVADDGSCRELVAAVVDRFGRLDILVNSAGTTSYIAHSDLEAVGGDDWDRILAVNLKGPFQVVRAARPHLEAVGSAEVVNVASSAGINAIGSSIPYCASKAGLINLTIALARVLGPTIRVNAVAPGFITGRWHRQGLGEHYDQVRQAVASRSALGAVCGPEDVADAILGLITGSDLVTGQTLLVDGGAGVGPKIS